MNHSVCVLWFTVCMVYDPQRVWFMCRSTVSVGCDSLCVWFMSQNACGFWFTVCMVYEPHVVWVVIPCVWFMIHCLYGFWSTMCMVYDPQCQWVVIHYVYGLWAKMRVSYDSLCVWFMICSVYGLWSQCVCVMIRSVYWSQFTVCGLCMSGLYNHCHGDASKRVWLSSSDKSQPRCHMLSGITDFAFEIVHVSATGRCIRFLHLTHLGFLYSFSLSFTFFSTLLLMPVELNYHSHCQHCLHRYRFQSQYRFVCESVHRAYSEGIVKPLPEFHRWERSTH